MKARGLLDKPLSASVRERLKDKLRTHPEAIGASLRSVAKLTGHRIAPPTAQQIASVHRLPAPSEPVKEAEPVAGKKKAHKHYSADYKAKLVARALKAKETGEESIEAIAAAEGIHGTNIHNWIKAAKQANGSAEPGKPGPKSKSNLKALSKELSEAMDRVSAIKKQMRKLLADD